MTQHEREVMRMALEALEAHADIGIKAVKQIEALRTCLAQPEPKPVAYLNVDEDGDVKSMEWGPDMLPGAHALYAAPPRREWVGLTDDEYELMAEKHVTNYFFNTLDYAHAIEAKLKEKNVY